MQFETALRARESGNPVPFLGCEVKTILSASHSRTGIVQRYRNAEETAIEVVYTFPLPSKAVLLGVSAKIGGTTVVAKVDEKKKASKVYEEALEKGHTALLMEYGRSGLHTINLGNLLAGEEAQIEIVYGEDNHWEDGLLHWRLPLTIAPRYGAYKQLEAHQVPETDAGQRHEATFELELEADLAGANVTSPSHRLEAQENGAVFAARHGSFAMDRDLVVDIAVEKLRSSAELLVAKGEAGVYASFIPKGEWVTKAGRNIKIVLDCSYSMQGDSIAAARQAVEEVLKELGAADLFNLIRFGSSHESMFPAQVKATRHNIGLAEDCVRLIAADMGGTEMLPALEVAFASAADGFAGGDVILITDGQVNNENVIVAKARESGHRIFTIGVGASVQESILRRMATETGAAAEFVVPGDAVRGAIMNQFRRVRSGAVRNVEMSWPGKPTYRTVLPRNVFAGDAIIVGALYAKKPKGEVVLSFETENGKMHKLTLDLGKAMTNKSKSDWDGLRMIASRQVRELEEDGKVAKKSTKSIDRQGLKLALAYHLLSVWTSLVVVRKNAKGERPLEMAELRQVKQMAPAGWAGLRASQHAVAAARPLLRSRGPAFGASWSASGATYDAVLASAAPSFDLFGAGVFEDTADFAAGFTEQARNIDQGFGRSFSQGQGLGAKLVDDMVMARIEKALLDGKAIESFADLLAFGVEKHLLDALKKLANTTAEKKLVRLFLLRVLGGKATSMAMRVLADRLGQGVSESEKRVFSQSLVA